MESFNKREKKLVFVISILGLLILFLSYKIVDYKISIMPVDGDKYVGPPSMEDSIKNASIIFICSEEANDEIVKYRIKEILYKDEKYEFPYAVGNFFPELEKRPMVGVYYDEEQLVILSTKSRIPKQTLRVIRGIIPGFKNITMDDFVKQVKSIKRENS